MLDNGGLGHGSGVGTGSVSTNAISESKDVLVGVVLHGVLVDINSTSVVTHVGDLNEERVGVGWRVDHVGEERFLNDFVSVNVSEDSNLFSDISSLDFGHFPSEHASWT